MKFMVEKLFYLILATISVEGNKRYDINREAHTTYGRNITGVLLNFRRSPDYLRILEQKREQLKDEIKEMITMTRVFYRTKLVKKVEQIIGINLQEARLTEPATSTIQYFRSTSGQPENKTETERLKKVKRIERYFKLSSYLTLQERIEFKNLGFQYIGDCLHATIENMGAEMSGNMVMISTDGDQNRETTPYKHSEEHNKVDKLWTLDKDNKIDKIWSHDKMTQVPA